MTRKPMHEHEHKLFVIHKSPGPTSFEVVDAFRKATGIRRVGHTGTLDPLAGGVLLLCTGKATRAVEHFMNLPKVYEFEIRLGAATDTLDAEGRIVEEAPVPECSYDTVARVAEGFVGVYEMEPPAYSALKRNGRRSYELARAGKPAPPRRKIVHIYGLEVVEMSLPSVFCRVRCGRGTYVRSLARDIGCKLGVPAHLGGLTRTAIGPFGIEGAFPSERVFERDVSEMQGIDLGEALDFMPAIVLSRRSAQALFVGGCPGRNDIVRSVGAIDDAPVLRLLDESGQLLAIGARPRPPERRRMYLVDSYRLVVDTEGICG